jgi:hypothetical protein
MGGADQEGEGGGPEGKADRHPQQHHHRQQRHEEKQQIPVADAPQRRRGQPQPRRRHRQRGDNETNITGPEPKHPVGAAAQHQPETDRDGAGAQDVGEPQRRGFDVPLVGGVIARPGQHDQQEQRRHHHRQHLRPRLPARRHRRHDRGQPHVLAALQRHHRAEHRQPQEQHRRQFVAPHQRVAEPEAADHAGQQYPDFHHHQQRRGDFHRVAQQRPDSSRQGGRAGRRHQVRLPTAPSSTLQACAPNFCRHSA